MAAARSVIRRTGARADVAIYRDQPDWTAMFARAHRVLKDGAVIVEDGEVVAWPRGRTLQLAVEADADMARQQFAQRTQRPAAPGQFGIQCGKTTGQRRRYCIFIQ